MISLFGSTIGATLPIILTAIPLGLGLLVVIFRRRGLGAPRVVSTLFLLTKLPERLTARRSFVPPLQFWLELLILSLLALAGAGLYVSSNSSRVAVVIDSSKSMGTLSRDGESRLQAAKRLSRLDVTLDGATSRFTIFAAHHSLSALSARRVSAPAALEAIESLPQTLYSDNISAAIAPLIASKEYDAVWVYTDKMLAQRSSSSAVRVVSIPTNSENLSNVWVRSLDTRESQNGPMITAEIVSSSPDTLGVEISASCFGSNYPLAPVESITVSLAPHQSTQTLLGPLSEKWSYCKVSAALHGSSSTDALDLDNDGWIARSSPDDSVVLVSALSATELGLSTLPGITLGAQGPTDNLSYRRTIYHRGSPRSVPHAPSLVVFPPAGALAWTGATVAQTIDSNSSVTRWAEAHPVLRYVQPSLLVLPEHSVIECPDSATPILFSSRGAIACAGEEHGARYVITGFELFPFDGIRSPTLSVLTLNAVRWLFQDTGAGSLQAALGSVVVPNTVSSASYVAPTNRPLRLAGKSVLIDEPGVVALTSIAGSRSSQTLRAFNAFSDSESDISAAATLEIPTSYAISHSSKREDIPLGRLLAAVALVMLCLDLIRRLRGRSLWGRV